MKLTAEHKQKLATFFDTHGWTKDIGMRDDLGVVVDRRYPETAVSFCARYGIGKALNLLPYGEKDKVRASLQYQAETALLRTLTGNQKLKGGCDKDSHILVSWNNAPERTIEEVRALFRSAFGGVQ